MPLKNKKISDGNSCLSNISNCVYAIWDGLDFFSFEEKDLIFFKGKPVKWYHKFYNKEWLLSNVLLFVIFVFVIVREVDTLGDVKSQ